MTEYYDLEVPDSRARNYFRLARLTMDLGTKVIRKRVISNLANGQTLHSSLEAKRKKFVDLNRKRIVSDKQLQILYPNNANADIRDIDITLWIVLLRNLVPSTNLVNVRWDSAPLADQTEWYHDVLRIREARNALFHCQQAELDQVTFEEKWSYITQALQRLDDTLSSFDNYLNTEVDREAVRRFQQQVNEQVLQETNDHLKAEVQRRSHLVTIIVFFVCIVLILVVGTVVALVYALQENYSCDHYLQFRETAIGSLNIMPRGKRGWGAENPQGPMDLLRLPAPYAIYTHTAETGGCNMIPDCCTKVRDIQYKHMHFHHNWTAWSDIAYHFLIDTNGNIYEGRALDKMSSATLGWNNRSISIALIGNYMFEKEISEQMLGSFDYLLADLRQRSYLTSNYILYAMCQVRPTDSPGKYLYRQVNTSLDYPEFTAHRQEREKPTCTWNFTIS